MPDSINTERHRRLIELLIEHRKRAGLTQTELTKRLGLKHQSHIARMESRQRRVDVIELIQLGEALQFDPNEIVSELSMIPE